MGYNDVLQLGDLLGTDVLISVGQLNQPSDWSTLIHWLSTSGWTSKYAASGHKIYLEDGNEAWNSGMGATLYYGNGMAYGYTLGPNMAAAKSAAGYDPNIIKLVGNSWVAPNQGYGGFGWVHNALTVARGTPNGLPDFVYVAPYTLNYLGNFDTHGSNVAGTGAPFLDEWAEDANLDSVTSPITNSQSMYLDQQYVKANFGVGTLVYEVNQSTTAGVAATQLQLDQIGASVGTALAIAEHVLLMQRDAQVSGPIHAFTLAEPYTGYNCKGSGCVAGAVMPLWGANLFMATGPGQTPGSANTDRPLAIALGVINNAIGSNTNLMAVTQSGTPTFKYPGGQKAERFAHHTCQPCSALCELLRLQQRAGKRDHDLLQQQSEHARVRDPGRARSPHRKRHGDHLPQGCQYRRSQRGQLPGRRDQSACRRCPCAILGQRLDLCHTSGILHRPQVYHRGAPALMPITFSEDREW